MLAAIGVLGVPLPSAGAPARKVAAKARTAAKGKTLSGSGFTLQERTGGLDVEAHDYLGNARTEAADSDLQALTLTRTGVTTTSASSS